MRGKASMRGLEIRAFHTQMELMPMKYVLIARVSYSSIEHLRSRTARQELKGDF